MGELPAPALRVVLGAGVALSGMITLGLWPRWCACLLFLLAATTHRALAPLTSPDDAFARLLALWLALLPVGRALTIVPPRRDLPAGAPALGVGLLAIFALATYIDVGAAIRSVGSMWPAVAGAAAAASLIAPGRGWRSLGVVPAALCAWQLHRLGGASLTGGALLACHAVIAIVPALGGPAEAGPAPRGSAPLDAPAAVAVSALLLHATHSVASAAGLASVAGASDAVLAQVGLGPAPWRVPEERRRDLAFRLARPDGEAAAPGAPKKAGAAGVVDPSDDHVQLLFIMLAAPSAPEPVRLSAARGLVARRCRVAPDEASPGELLVTADGLAEFARAVAWFDCGDGAAPPKVVLLGAGAAAGGGNKSRPAGRPVEQHPKP
jgi:hypothetical protein